MVVSQSRLKWWDQSDRLPPNLLLVIVASYSHYDLAMLDLLDEEIGRWSMLASNQPVPTYVANLLAYPAGDSLIKEFPIVKSPPLQTLLTLVWKNGAWVQSATGKFGRDLAATMLGVAPDILNQRVIARIPRYSPA